MKTVSDKVHDILCAQIAANTNDEEPESGQVSSDLDIQRALATVLRVQEIVRREGYGE